MIMQRNEIILIIEGLLRDKKKRKLHISLNSGRFYNGIVIDYEDNDVMSFNDNKLGHITILFSQVINIEPMIER